MGIIGKSRAILYSNVKLEANLNPIRKADRKPCVILHGILTARDTRVLAGLLNEQVLAEKDGHLPVLPIQLSPYQVRLLPMNQEAFGILNQVQNLNYRGNNPLRMMIDSRGISENKSDIKEIIRAANADWVPITVLLGRTDIAGRTVSAKARNLYPGERAGKQIAENLDPEAILWGLFGVVDDVIQSQKGGNFPMDVGVNPFPRNFDYSTVPSFLA